MVYKNVLTLAIILTAFIAYSSIETANLGNEFYIIQSSFAQNTSTNDGNNNSSYVADNLSSTTTTQTNNLEYNIYSNSTLGVKIELPSNWFYKENNTSISILSPPENRSNNSGDYTTVSSIDIQIENVSTNLNQGQLTQMAVKTINESLTNFHIDKSNTTILAGAPANEIIYSGKTHGGNNAKGLLIWTVKDSKVHSITYSVVTTGGQPTIASGEFERQLPIINHIIKSFEITK